MLASELCDLKALQRSTAQPAVLFQSCTGHALRGLKKHNIVSSTAARSTASIAGGPAAAATTSYCYRTLRFAFTDGTPQLVGTSKISRGRYDKGGSARTTRCNVANFSKGLLGAIMPNLSGQKETALETLCFLDSAPSWEELKKLAGKEQKKHGVDFWSDPNDGPTNPLASKRTFGKEGPIRVKLYRDHAAWCPYCQKVWLQLEEKQIPYILEKINMRCYGDKPADFMRMVPSGLLPVLELDGKVITESAVIMNVLENTFPERPLLPRRGSKEREKADRLMYLEREVFRDWLEWLCTSWNQGAAQRKFEETLERVCKALTKFGVGKCSVLQNVACEEVNGRKLS